MELLASNQPWNLVVYMAIPVILAETIAICELYLLYTRNQTSWVKTLSRYSGIFAAIYMMGIFLNILFTAVLPLTTTMAWRGMADVVAVVGYLFSAIPLIIIGLIELGLVGRNKSAEEKLKIHAICVAVFLVLAHVAMIFGMIDPTIFGAASTMPVMVH